MNCETSMYQSSTGAIWTVVPQVRIDCIDVPAYELTALNVDQQHYCTWGNWYPSDGIDMGTKHGFSDCIEYPERKNGFSCGFANWGAEWYRAWASWKLNRHDNWQFCKAAEQVPYMYRKDPTTGETQTITPQQYLTVDPNSFGRQHGWYTSGDKEVIADGHFQEGKGSSLIFVEPENWQDYFKKYHFKDGLEVTFDAVDETSTHPSSFQCRVLMTLENGADFEEFREPCSSVWSSQADDGVSGIKIMTSSASFCTVCLGFGDDNRNTTISVKVNHPVTLAGADRWQCTTQENFGVDCSVDKPFMTFSAEIVNASIKTTVTRNGGGHSDPGVSDDTNLGLDFSDIGGIFTIVGIVIAAVVVAIVIIVLIVKFVKYKMNQKKVVEFQGQPQVQNTSLIA
jgi:hypothetical protein